MSATVSIRRRANRRADIAIATALSSTLMTAVRDRKRWARSAALYARSLLSSRFEARTESGSSFCMAALNSATASSAPATSSA